MKKHLVRFILGALCVLVMIGHAGHLWQQPFVSALDAYLYDAHLRLSTEPSRDDRIVIVDIDEKSLAELGRWPWSRKTVADLVQRLTDDYQVAVIGFDVVFAEPDDSSGLKVLDQLGRHSLKNDAQFQSVLKDIRPQLDFDRVFADVLRGRPVVLGYYFSDKSQHQIAGALPPPVFPPGSLPDDEIDFIRHAGFGGNLKLLQEAAASAGHFNPGIDSDGIVRRVPMLIEYGGAYYEALSLAVLRAQLGDSELRAVVPGQAIEALLVFGNGMQYSVPVDRRVSALVPYRGEEHSFPYLSAVDVLTGKISPEQLKGRIVLVGTSAPGLNDLRSTPVGAAYPGVEVHANLIAGMLDGNIKDAPAFLIGAELLQLLLLGSMLVFMLPLLSPFRATLLALGVLAGIIAINAALWSWANLVMPLATSLLLTVLLYALNMSWGYFVESRSKRRFAELFGQYVPPELVDEMARNPESYSMEGRNEELTVLFADIRSFTSISEGLDPKELTQLMNEYLGAMTDVIRGNRGTLDKYIGDAIMAFWGAPVRDADNARHAVLTALAMQSSLQGLAEPFRARQWPELQIGIGVNTGMMTVGDMGSPVRKAYTVMGDAVNLASRLEGITKEYGVGVVVGESTRHKVQDVHFRELDRVRVKGKDEPVAIYEPLGLSGTLPDNVLDELACWELALGFYRAQAWDQAELQLYNLRRMAPDARLYVLYTERVATLRASPPGENWDGVTTFQTK